MTAAVEIGDECDVLPNDCCPKVGLAIVSKDFGVAVSKSPKDTSPVEKGEKCAAARVTCCRGDIAKAGLVIVSRDFGVAVSRSPNEAAAVENGEKCAAPP